MKKGDSLLEMKTEEPIEESRLLRPYPFHSPRCVLQIGQESFKRVVTVALERKLMLRPAGYASGKRSLMTMAFIISEITFARQTLKKQLRNPKQLNSDNSIPTLHIFSLVYRIHASFDLQIAIWYPCEL